MLGKFLLTFRIQSRIEVIHRDHPHGNAFLLDHLKDGEGDLLDLLIFQVQMGRQAVFRQTLGDGVEGAGGHAHIAHGVEAGLAL